MLKLGQLDGVFQMYWDDMQRCRLGKAYWSLLHVTVCLPDICAALQADDGRTSEKLYVAWCDRHLSDKDLSGKERYWMRCKVLHQGRASTGHPGRYSGFAFGQPAATGQVDHRRLEGTTLVLDVGTLSAESESGVRHWIKEIEADLAGHDATNVHRNLPTIVRVRKKRMPTTSGTPQVVVWNNRTS